jgi:Gpi18-like mannosyltransferase
MSKLFVVPRVALFVLVLAQALLLAAMPLTPLLVPSDVAAQLFSNGLIGLFVHWDVPHYLDIAQNGYRIIPNSEYPTLHTAFFPLWPLLIRSVATLFGQYDQATLLVAALLINQVVVLLALCLLMRLALCEQPEAAFAKRTVLYTALAPLGIFFFIPYTEALFLAISVGAFLAMRRRAWLVAGIVVALANATRITGLLLIPVLLCEIVLAWRERRFEGHELLRAGGGLLLAPLGLLSFMALLWWSVGDPLAFVQAQAYWNRERVFPLVTLWRGLVFLFMPAAMPQPVYLHNAIQISMILLFAGISLASLRRWRLSYSVYAMLIFILALISPLKGYSALQSAGRYVLVLFPVFFTLAAWGSNPRMHRMFLLVGIVLALIFGALYLSGYFIA